MEELFDKYRKKYSSHFMTAEQREKLRDWHEKVGRDGITLSQIDNWLFDAQLLPFECSKSDSGLAFINFKSFALDFNQFLKFLELLSERINLSVDDLHLRLLKVEKL
ncbi:hypothetical protein PVAND_016673 [Polypedilum vanderplanki]|uniref:TPPP family protein n=1 Tax=Polypedilum vanderplanki TaxID=319348 RepID=A0A9J6BGA5_POLVA|nr:hypothetical protein PVAND_016673 [Polypedilum vanderplanki]